MASSSAETGRGSMRPPPARSAPVFVSPGHRYSRSSKVRKKPETQEEMTMSVTRRRLLASAAAVAAAGIAKPAVAQKSPIQIGYLPALTGPSSSTGVGINRGVQLAVEEIN